MLFAGFWIGRFMHVDKWGSNQNRAHEHITLKLLQALQTKLNDFSDGHKWKTLNTDLKDEQKISEGLINITSEQCVLCQKRYNNTNWIVA